MYEDEQDSDSQSDEAIEGEAEVWCPYCGERTTIAIDAGGGGEQDYVEDCPVCCRPWNVHVHMTGSGGLQVSVEEAQ